MRRITVEFPKKLEKDTSKSTFARGGPDPVFPVSELLFELPIQEMLYELSEEPKRDPESEAENSVLSEEPNRGPESGAEPRS